MKYCQNCGKQIDDTAKFCGHCGCVQSSPQQQSHAQTQTAGRKRLHCPQCKATLLVPIVEAQTTGGAAVHTPLTRRVGVTGYSMQSVHRNYWMCQSCGHKFRNLENLKEELVTESKRMKGCLFMSVFCGILTVLLFILLNNVPELLIFLGFPAFLIAVAMIVFIVTWFITRNKVNKMVSEKAYLETNCFD